MNDDLLKAIHQELVAIRQLLAEGKGPAASSTSVRASTPSSSASRSSGVEEEVPQPTEIIANAGAVQVHFGKNNGVALAKLSERSLSWYAQEQAPRLDSSGNPYPARPQEITLRNAARTLWHQNRGSLGGHAAAAKSSPSASEESFIESTSHPADQEESMPF
jgi:hypothetical protein